MLGMWGRYRPDLKAGAYGAAIATVLVCAIGHGTAFADDVETADRHYQQGKAYFRVGEFELCVREFQKSFALVPKSGALFNLARCHEEQGQLAEALKNLQAYLKLDPEGSQSIEAKARSAAIHRKLSEGTEPQPATDSSPATLPANVAPTRNAPDPAETRSLVSSTRQPLAEDNTRRNLAIGSAAFGTVGLGLATYFALSASGDWNTAQELCPNSSPCDDPTGVALSRDAESAGTMATVFTGVSVVALAAAGYFWFTRPDTETSSLQLTPAGSPNGGSVRLEVIF